MASGKKTGGRQKGARNKKTAEKIKAIEASGLMPLDYLLAVMRSTDTDPHFRADAAKAAAPYVHAKLASIEHTGKDGGPIETKSTDSRDISRAILAILREAQTE